MNFLLTLNEWLVVLALGIARMTATLVAFSPLRQGVFTGMARNTLIISLSLLILPSAFAGYVIHRPPTLAISLLIMKEVFIGLYIGFFCSLVFSILESVGSLIDMQRGSSMASLFDPSVGGTTTVTGSMLNRLFIFIFFFGGFFLLFLGLYYESFRVWPLFELLPVFSFRYPDAILGEMDFYMRTLFTFAAPMLVIMLVIDLAFGLINRFAPQLNVFFLAMPVKSAGALLMLIIILWLIVELIVGQSFLVRRAFQLIRSLFLDG